MSELYPQIDICEFCNSKRHVRSVTVGKGYYKTCAQCEIGMEKAKARRIANLTKPHIEEEDD